MKATNPIAAAVEPYRAEAIERSKTAAANFAARVVAEIEAANGDLDVVAPRPRSNMSRRDYAMARDRRSTYESLISETRESAEKNRYVPHPKRVYARDEAKIARFVEQAGRDASVSFDGYIAKLTAKVGEEPAVVAASVDSGSLWTYSHLKVERADGSVERWRTKAILNVSVLGKLFNQWPTRRVK